MKRKIILVLALPSLIGVLIFYLIPFVESVRYVFLNDAFNKEFVGMYNIETVVGSGYFRLAVKNTVLFTVISVPTIILLSYILALILTYVWKNNKFLQVGLFLPYILPSVSITTFWSEYFERCVPFVALIVIYLWKYTGFNVILFITSFHSIKKEVLESSDIDGANFVIKITRIILPNSVPMILFVGIISFVNSFKIYRESYLLWGDYPEQSVYMLQNYLNNHFEKLNYQNVATAADIFFVVIFVVILIVLQCEKKWSETVW